MIDRKLIENIIKIQQLINKTALQLKEMNKFHLSKLAERKFYDFIYFYTETIQLYQKFITQIRSENEPKMNPKIPQEIDQLFRGKK